MIYRCYCVLQYQAKQHFKEFTNTKYNFLDHMYIIHYIDIEQRYGVRDCNPTTKVKALPISAQKSSDPNTTPSKVNSFSDLASDEAWRITSFRFIRPTALSTIVIKLNFSAFCLSDRISLILLVNF